MGEESEREKVLGESILCPSRYPLSIHCGVLFMKNNDILQKSLSWDFLSLSKITWNIAKKLYFYFHTFPPYKIH